MAGSALQRWRGLERFKWPMRRASDVLAAMAALPFAGLDAITGGQPILVLAPHPDDESLGCGGLIAQACAHGTPVHVAVLTDGSRSHPNSKAFPAPRLIALREAETEEATAALGLPSGQLSFLGYPDAAAPSRGAALTAAAARLAALMAAQGVGTVCATWAHDPHCDHLAAHRIAARAARLGGVRHLSYAVWGWTLPRTKWLPREELQGVRLDISGELAAKRRAIACHRSQHAGLITDDPAAFTLPRSLLKLCDRPFEVFLTRATPPSTGTG